MNNNDVKLMAHLMRRAGFGATRRELDTRVAKGYEATVEELLKPDASQVIPDDVIRRYHPDQAELRIIESMGGLWMYRLATSTCPLQEKMVLFWHGLFATGELKVQQGKTMMSQIDMFRRQGLGSFQDILIALSKDPAMIFWLDNNDSHKESVNENYGRELLELFSMGIGNYTENDVNEASRAFTGWTIQNNEYMSMRVHKASIWPYGKIAWQFEYNPDDHDAGEKTFLGETGDFNGEDIVRIIAKQPATAKFICTRLYQFFVSNQLGEGAKTLTEQMMDSYFSSGYDISSVLRVLFNSDHFKSLSVRSSNYKSPIELVVGTLRIADNIQWPTLEIREAAMAASYMGQEILNPPSVEGWHEGQEWIDSGALIERVNFASRYLGDVSNPGIRKIVETVNSTEGTSASPENVVDICLDMLGAIEVTDSTRTSLIDHVATRGNFQLGPSEEQVESEKRIADLLMMIASTQEYQMA
ncbi:DUF1800 domain-containing protein [Dehalococcoidia bacterium]|nr:DUF1800 domain-containing protein [Dehalococcoidia bacterium]